MKGIGKKSLSVLMTLVMLVGIIADLHWGFDAVEVFAQETSSEITVKFDKLTVNGVEYVDGMTVPESSTFNLTLEWNKANNENLPKNLTIKLPESIQFPNLGTTTLTYNAEGIGTYTVENGVIKIELDNPSQLAADVSGKFTFGGTLNYDKVQKDENGKTKFELYDKTINVNVTDSSNLHQLYVQKSYDGAYDYDNGLTFKVQVSSMGTNKNIRIEDIFDTSKIEMVDTGSLTVTSNKQGTVRGTLQQNGEGFSYVFPDNYEMQDGETCTLSYTLKFNDKAFTSDYINGTNKVYAESETGKSNEATTWFNVDKTWVDKTGTYNQDGTVTWNIVLNRGVSTDIAGTALTDILPSEFELNSDITISGSDGFNVTIPKENAASGIQYTFPTDREYTGTYTITYTTTVTTNDKFNMITGGWSSNNTAQINSPKYGKHQDSANVYIPGIGNVLDKTHTGMNEDFEHGRVYVDWKSTITIPADFPLDLSEFTYTDALDMNQWNNRDHRLVQGSVMVNGQPATDYNIEYSCGDDRQTFSIPLGNSFKAGDTIVITYQSYFDLPQENSTRWNITNTGTVNFGKVSQSDSDTTNYSYVPAVSKSFNGTTDNTVFEWVVRINLKNAKLQDNDKIYIEEQLPENQKLDAGSLYAVKGTWAYNGQWDGGRSKNGITDLSSGNVIRYEIDTAAVMKADEGDKNIIILMYKTEIDDYKEFLKSGRKDYINKVTVSDKENKPVGSAEAKASNIAPSSGKTLNKNFEYTASTAPNVYYYIDVNTDGRTLLEGNPLTLTDVMGPALQYVPNSFKVYTNPGRTAALGDDEWSMQYDSTNNTITVTLPDSTPLYIAYQARVTLGSGEALNSENANNTVSLSGELEDTVSSSKPLYGSVLESNAIVFSKMGAFILYKHKKDDIDSFVANAEYTATIKYQWVNGHPEEVTENDLKGENFKFYEPDRHYVTRADGTVVIDNIYPDMLYEIKEVAAPSGYKLNTKPVYYYIVGDDQSDYASALNIDAVPVVTGQYIYVDDEEADKVLPTISILKKDEKQEGTAGLGGARLELSCTYNGNKRTVETWTSSADAKIFSVDSNGNSTDSNVLKYGPDYVYTLHEISAPYGFKVADDITFTLSYSDGKVTINPTGGTWELSNENTRLTMTDKHQILIQKIASDTNGLLPGVELELTKDGTSVATWNTKDENPKSFDSLDGSYILTETSAPADYQVAAPISFTVANGKIQSQTGGATDGVTLTMTDQALGKLKITKVDFVNNTPLAGARFTLTGPGGTYTAKENANNETGTDGILTFENLPYGTYTLKETTIPDGYEINQSSYTIVIDKNTVDNNKTVTRTITNTKMKEKTGKITITKKNEGGSVNLADAEFTLVNDPNDPDTKPYSATGTTKANGELCFDNVPYGNYLLEESKAPYGYAETPKKVTIGGNAVAPLNGKYPIALTGDVDDLSLEITVNDEQLLGNLEIAKVDDRGISLDGAEFELRKADGTEITTGVTSRTGTTVGGVLSFTNLPYGKYILKETKAPDGYNITVAEQSVVIDSDRKEVKVTNNRKSVYIGKTAVDNDVQLGGAEFEICDAAGNSLNPAITFTSSNGGKQQIYLGNNAGELKPGTTYTLKETKAPNGYMIGADVKFTVGTDGKISVDNTVKNAAVSSDGLTLTMKDEPIGKITLRKLDALGDHSPLPGAKFTLYESDGTTIVTDKNGECKDRETGPNGELVFEDIPYGEYILEETEAPTIGTTQYELQNEKLHIELSENNKNILVYNQEHQDKTAKIVFKKVGEGNNPLRGAEFRLYQGNKYIASSISDESGVVVFEDIPYEDGGTECDVLEVKAPVGYKDIQTSVSILLNDSTVKDGEYEEQDGELTIHNELIRVDITVLKTNEDGTKNLEGAKFTLYESDGTTIATDKDGKKCEDRATDADGKVIFEGIPYGEYVLEETDAPDHYSIVGDGKKILYLNNDTVKSEGNGTESVTYSYAPITITNKQNTVSISKQDIYTHNDLKDATLQLTAAENTKPLVLNMTGTAKEFKIGNTTDLDNYVLAPGETYTLTETGVPDGYMQATPIEFVIENDVIKVTGGTSGNYDITDNDHLIMYDEPYGNIQIKKVDANIKEALNGAEFTLYETDGTTEVRDGDGLAVRTTSNGGVVTFTKLPYGTYILKETEKPSGYLTITEEIRVTIDADTVNAGNLYTVSREVANTPTTKVGNIEITKYVRDEDKTELAQTLVFEFGLYKPTNLATPVLLQTTDGGKVTFENIPFGTYYIKEESAPFGYDSTPVSVEINGKDAAKHTTDSSVFYEVVVGDGGKPTDDEISIEVSVVDKKLKGSLQIKKISFGTKEPIEGVIFDLYLIDAAGNKTLRKTNITTNDKGIATVPDLEFGNYILTETKTGDNYILPVDGNENTEITLNKVEPTEVTITNEPKKGKYKIKKIDSVDAANGVDAEGLPGAVYEIYNIKDKSLPPSMANLGNKVASGTTDSDGEYEFNNIPYGTYYLVEEAAPEDYAVDKNIKIINIPTENSTDDLIELVAVDDSKLTGNLVVRKVDLDTKYLLSDAKFVLLDSNKKVVIKEDNKYKETIDDTEENRAKGTYSTSKNEGEIVYNDLPCGSYTLIEVEAPDYYKIVTKEFDVYVNPSEQKPDPLVADEKEVPNENVIFQISKRIKRGTSELPEAELQLLQKQGDEEIVDVTWDSEGNPAPLMWTTDGAAKLIGLGTGPGQILPGTYILRELRAPKGYARVMEDLTFTVDETGKIAKVGEWKVGADGLEPDGEVISIPNNREGTDTIYYIDAVVMYDELADSVPPKMVKISKASAGGTGTVYGAQLWIWNADKTKVMAQLPLSGDEPYEITVGSEENPENGIILMYNEAYILEEVATPENEPYYAKADDITFRIDFNGEFIIDSGVPEENLSDVLSEGNTHLTMLDDRIITISKKEVGKNEELAGASLELYEGTDITIEEKRVADWTSFAKPHEITVGIGENSIKFNTTYTLVEKDAPTGFLKAEPISFSVNPDGTIVTETGELSENRRELTMRDMPGVLHTITISKKAVGGTAELGGTKEAEQAVLYIVDEQTGKEVDRWRTQSSAHEVHISSGRYSLHEEKAPGGYVLNPDPIYFIVNSDGKIESAGEVTNNGTMLTMRDNIDEDNIIYISKKEIGGTNELPGAKFTIFKSNLDGSIGEAVIENLTSAALANPISVGESEQDYLLQFNQVYILRETEAPTGYLTTDDIRFAVEPDGKILAADENNMPVWDSDAVSADRKTLTMRDPVAPTSDAFTDVPKTGDDTPLALLIILLIAAAAAIAGLAITGRKKTKLETIEDEEE